LLKLQTKAKPNVTLPRENVCDVTNIRLLVHVCMWFKHMCVLRAKHTRFCFGEQSSSFIWYQTQVCYVICLRNGAHFMCQPV